MVHLKVNSCRSNVHKQTCWLRLWVKACYGVMFLEGFVKPRGGRVENTTLATYMICTSNIVQHLIIWFSCYRYTVYIYIHTNADIYIYKYLTMSPKDISHISIYTYIIKMSFTQISHGRVCYCIHFSWQCDLFGGLRALRGQNWNLRPPRMFTKRRCHRYSWASLQKPFESLHDRALYKMNMFILHFLPESTPMVVW